MVKKFVTDLFFSKGRFFTEMWISKGSVAHSKPFSMRCNSW